MLYAFDSTGLELVTFIQLTVTANLVPLLLNVVSHFSFLKGKKKDQREISIKIVLFLTSEV